MTHFGNTEDGIKTMTKKATGSFAALNKYMEDMQENKGTTFQEQCSAVRSAVFCRVLKLTKGICHMLEVFQNKCLRIILYIFWPNKISNA